MASLSLLIPLLDYWRQLREGTRDNIIGGLVVALIIAVAVVFRDTLIWVVKRIDSAKQPQAVLDDLTHGEGDAAKRVFDRSFDLPQVGNDGRATLLALSLFVPSASRGALAEVAGFGNATARLDRAVQQLTELWLIEGTQGNERFRVEGLTRELAKARLSSDERADEYRRQFVAHFANFAAAHLAIDIRRL